MLPANDPGSPVGVPRRLSKQEAQILGAEVARLCRAALAGDTTEEPMAHPGLEQALTKGGVLGLVAPVVAGTWLEKPCAEARWRQEVAALVQSSLLTELLGTLRSEGLDPVLLKGLSVARLYGREGARATGDIDLLIPEDDIWKAARVLEGQGYRPSHTYVFAQRTSLELTGAAALIELQSTLHPLEPSDTTAALRSSSEMELEHGCRVRILPPDLEVRFLAAHAAKHWFSRAMWLCDLAVALRHHPGLNWEGIARGPRALKTRVLASLGLALLLTGTREPSDVIGDLGTAIQWLVPPVLAQWGRGEELSFQGGRRRTLIDALRKGNFPQAAVLLSSSRPSALQAMNEFDWPLEKRLAWPSVILYTVLGTLGLRLGPSWWAGRDG